LRDLVDTYETGEVSGNHYFKVPLDFYPGRCDDLNTIAAQGMDSEEDFFLPMPRLREGLTLAMSEPLRAKARR